MCEKCYGPLMSERAEIRAIDWSVFDRLCAEKGWKSDPRRATGCGISYQHLRHLRAGKGQPGGRTIDRLIATFGAEMYPALITRRPAETAVA